MREEVDMEGVREEGGGCAGWESEVDVREEGGGCAGWESEVDVVDVR